MRLQAKHRGRSKRDLGRAAFVMFDEKTEAIAKRLGLEVWFPSARLRTHVDDKIETVRIGDAAGVPSVPDVLAPVTSWKALRDVR